MKFRMIIHTLRRVDMLDREVIEECGLSPIDHGQSDSPSFCDEQFRAEHYATDSDLKSHSANTEFQSRRQRGHIARSTRENDFLLYEDIDVADEVFEYSHRDFDDWRDELIHDLRDLDENYF